MIERLYIKSLLGFEQVELEFASGLVVFSGPSGAGKSVLMSAILAGFGRVESISGLCELELSKPASLSSELYDIEDSTVIKLIKKNALRCYIDGQSIPKKALREMFEPYVYYLSVRDKGGFESSRLIELFDRALSSSDEEYAALIERYDARYRSYKDSIDRLEQIEADERELSEKIEFATFEIEKIRTINPKEDELEELMTTKRQLSRIEKIEDAARRAEAILDAEGAVEELLGLLEKDSSYLSDALNQLRADMDAARQLVEELGEIDVEAILDRLEQLNSLIKRHGSIADAMVYLADKEAELAGYTHIQEDKEHLIEMIKSDKSWLEKTAADITAIRQKYADMLAEKMSGYLSALKLPKVSFVFDKVSLGRHGVDMVDLELSGSTTATLSGGEHNRLRLALMASALTQSDAGQGVVILDEIDANVSGDESIAIADMISELSRVYQVFAISHQPHLAAKADQHILVTKSDTDSTAIELSHNERIQEIARIIGGESADDEAIAFASKLIGE